MKHKDILKKKLNSPAEALSWCRNHYFKIAGYFLLVFIGTGIGRFLTGDDITLKGALDELAVSLLFFMFLHIAILIGIFVVGPMLDYIRANKPDSTEDP